MDKKLERKVIWILVFLLILIGLNGCGTAPLKAITSKPIEKKVTIIDSISNMDAIAKGLGCLFAPNDPTCIKSKPPISTLTEVQD